MSDMLQLVGLSIWFRASCKIQAFILPKLQLGVSGDSKNQLTVSTVYKESLESFGNR